MTDIFGGPVSEIKPIPETQNALRKKYCQPQLKSLGDLRSITLGGSVEPDYDTGWPTNPLGDYKDMAQG